MNAQRISRTIALYLRSAPFWGITQRRVLIIYRRFGTTYRSIRCLETSVKDYHSTLRYTPEQRSFHQHRIGSLKSRIALNLFTLGAKRGWMVNAAHRQLYLLEREPVPILCICNKHQSKFCRTTLMSFSITARVIAYSYV
jgi:hypothetical protein